MLVKTEHPTHHKQLLQKFAHMARNSEQDRGEGPVDGWGMSWLDAEHEWQEHRSIRPIWEEEHWFDYVEPTKFLLVHARAEKEPLRKRRLMFNQPFIDSQFGFVCEGLIHSIAFPYPVPGEIESQQIWHLLQAELSGSNPDVALLKVFDLIKQHANHMESFNIGLSDGKHLYAFSHFADHVPHHALHAHASPGIKIVSSQSLHGYDFYPLPSSVVSKL